MVLHSGSRGIGNQLAQAHIAEARRLAKDFDLRHKSRHRRPGCIAQVMADQADLVEVRHTLRQVFNYRGT